MLDEEYETEASMLHDSQIIDSSETDVTAEGTDANELETEPADMPNSREFEQRKSPATKFYTTQLERMYESGLKCYGKDPAAIVAELEEKVEEIKASTEFNQRKVTKAQLDAIKVDVPIEPLIFAREVTEEINK